MPKNKDLKRLARTRMRKTGESYTTARALLIDKKKRAAGPAKPDYPTVAGMSDEAVEAKTGSDWERWVRALDRVGAASWPHKKIATHVREKYGVSGWWAQTVTVGYERIKGLRDHGQRCDGSYEMSKSKTFPVAIDRLYRVCRDVRARRKWLPGVELEVRKATPGKSMRVTWEDGTAVDLYFWAKGNEKSQLQLQHRKLDSKAEAEKLKVFWGERLAALGEVLNG